VSPLLVQRRFQLSNKGIEDITNTIGGENMTDKNNKEGLREFESKMQNDQEKPKNAFDKGRKPDQQNRLKDQETRLP
jgi:hypothetical protein